MDGSPASRLAHTITSFARSAKASMAAAVLVVAALTAGFLTGFPIWWQTVVNSSGALVSLLMLFVIQHTSHQHTSAILLKLDELIRSDDDARNDVLQAEEQSVAEQEEMHHRLRSHDA
ncbi:MAG: low affinity iron permease family protein [Nocardiaceae bacterium]|nr:low affinity iron permease family protein [Nocardiaceae bacterium]